MVKVGKVGRSYMECDSCGKSKKHNDVCVNMITIGLESKNHGKSFKLCNSCFDKMIFEYKEGVIENENT